MLYDLLPTGTLLRFCNIIPEMHAFHEIYLSGVLLLNLGAGWGALERYRPVGLHSAKDQQSLMTSRLVLISH